MNPFDLSPAVPFFICLLLAGSFLITGLLTLARTRRTLAWYGMVFGTLLLACSFFIGLNLAWAGNFDLEKPSDKLLIELAIFFGGLFFGAIFFFASFLSHAFTAARVRRRVRELESLCANVSAELTLLRFRRGP